MGSIVDARGLSCPTPVMLTIKEMEKLKKGEIAILVDTDTAKENVSRVAASKGWILESIEPYENGYKIVIKKD